MRKHWVLPQNPDVLQTLTAQADITVAGAIAFASWASGDLTQEARSGHVNTRPTRSGGS